MKHHSLYSPNSDDLAQRDFNRAVEICRHARRRRRELLAALGRSGFRAAIHRHGAAIRSRYSTTWRELSTADRIEWAILTAWLDLRRAT